ncbi:MAG: hypothetical protein ACM3X4_06525 [Ignavibacteriales bacterium]
MRLSSEDLKRIWPFFIYSRYDEGRRALWEFYHPDRALERKHLSLLRETLRLTQRTIKETPVPFCVRDILGRHRILWEEILSPLLARLNLESVDSEEDRKELLEAISKTMEGLGPEPLLTHYEYVDTRIDVGGDGWVLAHDAEPRAYLWKYSDARYRLIVPSLSVLGSGWLFNRISALIPGSSVTPIISLMNGSKPVPCPRNAEDLFISGLDWSVMLAEVRLKDPQHEKELIDLIQWWLQWGNPIVGGSFDFFMEARDEEPYMPSEEAMAIFGSLALPSCRKAWLTADREGKAELWPLYTAPAYPRLPSPQIALEALPYPFSIRYVEVTDKLSLDAGSALHDFLGTAERLIAFLAICYATILQETCRVSLSKLLKKWDKMSIGSWIEILMHDPPHQAEGVQDWVITLFRRLLVSDPLRKVFRRISRLRNQEAGLHPVTHLPPPMKTDLIGQYRPDWEMLHFFTALGFREMSLVLPEVSSKGALRLVEFRGPTATQVRDVLPFQLMPSIEIGQPALSIRAPEGIRIISLFPLLLWDYYPESRIKELFLYNGVDMNTHEALYVSLSTHHELDSSGMWQVVCDCLRLR